MRLLPRLWREYRSLIAFLVLMALFRSAIADWNVVPSGSMLPTIREGDRIVVDKMAYDLRIPFTHVAIAHLHDPQRGDIVTVDSSAAHELIVKRLIGLPGDVVAMRDNVLYIDGRRADYQPVDITGVAGDALLAATGGTVTIHENWWNPERATVRYLDGRTVELDAPFEGGGLNYETAHFCELLRDGVIESPIMRHAVSMQMISIMDAARRDLGVRFPFETE